MTRTVVLNVVGLTSALIGRDTPFLRQWAMGGKKVKIHPSFPAVTCTAQTSYLSGKNPGEHGIVGNGWYFREEHEVKFWRQSDGLVQASRIWEEAKKLDPGFTCANLFWWYNMYSSADYSVTPRPQYLADGRKYPDIYTYPAGLREELQKKLGIFPLFDFWGPGTSIRSSQWIAEAAKFTEERYSPTLTLVYLPHLDYNLQRFGPEDERIIKDLREIDVVCKDLILFYESRGVQVIVLSEYGITRVSHAVSLNRILRKKGYLTVREERGLELLDAGASEAFAVADHQVAHVYVKDKGKIPEIKSLLESINGVEKVLDETGKKDYCIDHDRAGDLIAVADPESWFTYYYWLEDAKAPDFARTVDIHRKPGYDPLEMIADPENKFLKIYVMAKLLMKKMGFRTLMDIIPLNPNLIKGSHGRIPESDMDYPVLITREKTLLIQDKAEAKDVFGILMGHLKSEKLMVKSNQ